MNLSGLRAGVVKVLHYLGLGLGLTALVGVMEEARDGLDWALVASWALFLTLLAYGYVEGWGKPPGAESARRFDFRWRVFSAMMVTCAACIVWLNLR